MDFVGSVNVQSSADNSTTVFLDGDRGDTRLGGSGQSGTLTILGPDEMTRLALEAVANGARLRIRSSENSIVGELAVALNAAILVLGGSGFDGSITVKNSAGERVIFLNGRDGDIILRNDSGEQTVSLSGNTGDVILSGADAAEEFETSEDSGEVSTGTVMVIDSQGSLRESSEAYDRRVAGVVSGGGSCRPGIILGRTQGTSHRSAIALIGRVFCKADAAEAPIEVGDLLTTSSTPGYAMKAADPARAVGSVIGKALQSLPEGKSLIPVLVTLQ